MTKRPGLKRVERRSRARLCVKYRLSINSMSLIHSPCERSPTQFIGKVKILKLHAYKMSRNYIDVNISLDRHLSRKCPQKAFLSLWKKVKNAPKIVTVDLEKSEKLAQKALQS